MAQPHEWTGVGFFIALFLFGSLSHASAADEERFEIGSLKAVRPSLIETIAALRQGDIPRAKAAFDNYDSGWNGIEVYINTRSKDIYRRLELELQPRITKALEGSNPDVPAALSELETMLINFDEAISVFEKATPLDPIYDDIARLRIVRAHLREVVPALKVGNVVRAQKAFDEFENTWFNIEDLVRARSLDAYVAIETGMVDIEGALLGPGQPDVVTVNRLVSNVMTQYNAVVAGLQKEARSR